MKVVDFKKRRLSEISKKKVVTTSHTLGTRFDNPERENMELLGHTRNLWDNMHDYRTRRKRARRYHRGDQWGDLITNPDTGQQIREEDYIKSQGRVPLKQNIIRQLMKNLMGQYRNNPTGTIVYAKNREDAQLSEMMSNAVRSVHDINYAPHIDASLILELALSGMAVGKQRYKYIPERGSEDIYMENINPVRIFYNGDATDPRQNDIRIIGELHDVPIMDVITSFAQSTEDEETIRTWYTKDYFSAFIDTYQAFKSDYIDGIDFYLTGNSGMCRVIEIWYKKSEWRVYAHDYADGSYKIVPYTLKEVEKINNDRITQAGEVGIPQEEVPLIVARRKYDQYWCVKYLTPYGHVLYEGESPYDHGEHPYTVVTYPGIDGEVWGLVEEIIDQQRYVNRAITLMDFLIASSAKGLLMIPESAIPYEKGWDENRFADEWTKVNGVIVYKAKPGINPPSQIANNSIPVGLQELLATQLKMAYDIAGIHQAIQGQQAKSGTPATLYAQEAQNATLNVKDFMETFSFYKQKRDMKIMKLIMQFYKEKRFLSVPTTVNYTQGGKLFDPEMIKNVEFDLKVTQGTDTPVYRQVIEDSLMGLFNAQAIDIKMYLEHSSMPFADKLLDSIKRREQEMAQQGGMGQIPPEMQEQLGAAAEEQMSSLTPQTQGILNKMLNEQQ